MKKQNKKTSRSSTEIQPSINAESAQPITQAPAHEDATSSQSLAMLAPSPVAIQVESNVPITSTVRSKKKNPKYPVAQVKVGQSFFVPCEGSSVAEARKKSNSVRSAVYHTKKQLGIFFVSRFTEHDDVHKTAGIRFWRVENEESEKAS